MNKELAMKYFKEMKAYESPELEMCRTQLEITALAKDQDIFRSFMRTLGIFFLMIDLRIDHAVSKIKMHKN